MKTMRKHRINVEIIFKLIVFLGFSVFFIILIKTGNVKKYVHPRIIPYMKFAVAGFIAISLFTIGEIFRTKGPGMNLKKYILFLIPLFLSFVIPPKTAVLSSSVIKGNGVNGINYGSDYKDNTNSKSDDTIDITADDTTTDDDTTTNGTNSDVSQNNGDVSADENNIAGTGEDYGSEQLKIEGNNIIVDDSNFAPWIMELYYDVEKYEGKNIEMVGFVYKDDESLKENEFVVARLMMVCCAADMQPVGIVCQYDKTSELKSEEWVKVKGILETYDFAGEKNPIIKVESIEPTDKPKEEIVYPY